MNSNISPTIISFGEVLWDTVEGQYCLGGAPFHLAAHCARLGARVRLISRVGDDELGHAALAEAAALGVGVADISIDSEHATGMVSAQCSDAGGPDKPMHLPAAWEYIELPAVTPAPVDIVCFGTIAQRGCISRSALHALLDALPGTPAFYDVNLQGGCYSKEIVEWGLHRANVVKVNCSEAAVLSELLFGREMSERQFASILRAAYELEAVVVTLGSKGCIAADSLSVTHLLGPNITVRHSVGAGDAFSAAFLLTWLRHGSAAEAASYGNVLGAYVATQNSAEPNYSDSILAQIRSFRGCKSLAASARGQGLSPA